VTAANRAGDAKPGAGGLIEGSVGPFYVALNRATFLLVGAIYALAVVTAGVVLRDLPAGWRVALALGLGFEAGTVAHIFTGRFLGWPRGRTLAVHAGTGAVVAAALFASFGLFP
jgi:hypothetical protein